MSDSENETADIFIEPTDFYQAAKEATFEKHKLLSGEELTVRLVGHNPLWGHHLWFGGRIISEYIEASSSSLIQGKCVLELGAGAGLPSLVAVIKRAFSVVVTDYPDPDLIENLQYNIQHCVPQEYADRISSEGFLWGASPNDLLAHLPPDDRSQGFHTIILADLLFNHSEHLKLVQSIQKTLRKGSDSRALVFFTPYRPWLLSKDLDFFRIASENGFQVKKTFEKVMDKVLFEKDPGDELLRRTVYGYELQWSQL